MKARTRVRNGRAKEQQQSNTDKGQVKKSGDNSVEDTPVPISNTVVKLHSADDTWREAAWESRTLPVLVKKSSSKELLFF